MAGVKFYGADVEDLRRTAEQFDRAAADLRDAANIVTRGVQAQFWVGPVATRFKLSWRQEHFPSVSQAATLLADSAQRLRSNAAEQENASRSDSGGGYCAARRPVFGPAGRYGGDQSAAKDRYLAGDQTLAEIIRRYHPELTDNEVEVLLIRMGHEGCGYMALVNTLAQQYADRPEEFERIFGFPLYDANGDFNFDYMITDLYAAEDNRKGHQFLWWKWTTTDARQDYSASDDAPWWDYNINEDTTGRGTNPDTREDRFERYLRDRGVSVDVRANGTPTTVKDYQRLATSGDVVIRVSSIRMTDADGALYEATGGHAMTVTGVNDDGHLIVSSWGKVYTVDPSDYGSGTGRNSSLQVIVYGS
ncbi:MAG: hypothetical protein LBE08_04990 [Bifidobacteriaceae bacterium]|jgi:hypothetical protein|nr:hypothetical protein [Bifidobacteriaceae bacterium]